MRHVRYIVGHCSLDSACPFIGVSVKHHMQTHTSYEARFLLKYVMSEYNKTMNSASQFGGNKLFVSVSREIKVSFAFCKCFRFFGLSSCQ